MPQKLKLGQRRNDAKSLRRGSQERLWLCSAITTRSFLCTTCAQQTASDAHITENPQMSPPQGQRSDGTKTEQIDTDTTPPMALAPFERRRILTLVDLHDEQPRVTCPGRGRRSIRVGARSRTRRSVPRPRPRCRHSVHARPPSRPCAGCLRLCLRTLPLLHLPSPPHSPPLRFPRHPPHPHGPPPEAAPSPRPKRSSGRKTKTTKTLSPSPASAPRTPSPASPSRTPRVRRRRAALRALLVKAGVAVSGLLAVARRGRARAVPLIRDVFVVASWD
jgi:hypothetical protein